MENTILWLVAAGFHERVIVYKTYNLRATDFGCGGKNHSGDDVGITTAFSPAVFILYTNIRTAYAHYTQGWCVKQIRAERGFVYLSNNRI